MFKSNTKFLIVDDFATMRKIVKKIISELGYNNAVEAVDGAEAYKLLIEHSTSKEPFEYLIVDWNMPNMSGLELLKKCRSEEAFKKIPIMFVTAEGEQSQILEAIKEGVTEYVIKPFTSEKIKEKLESSFKKLGPNAMTA